MLDTPTPTLDPISLARQDIDPDGFARDFGNSFQRFGFGVISDHGLDQDLIDRAWALTRQFFALPEEVKARYILPGKAGARGYTPFGIETAKGATENDLKELPLFKPHADSLKKKIAVGVVSHRTLQADFPEVVADRVRRAAEVIPAFR